MSNKTFKWDATALDREQTEPIDLLGDGDKTIFYELPRKHTIAFIAEAREVKTSKPGKVKELDAEGNETGKLIDEEVKLSLEEMDDSQRKMLSKYLSLSTCARVGDEPKRSFEYFYDGDLTANQFGRLSYLIQEINHVEDILVAGGNWMLLPTIYRVAEADAALNQ